MGVGVWWGGCLGGVGGASVVQILNGAISQRKERTSAVSIQRADAIRRSSDFLDERDRGAIKPDGLMSARQRGCGWGIRNYVDGQIQLTGSNLCREILGK